MKQNYFEDLDTGWDDLISDVYNNSKYFKPEYEIIDGKKYISKQYTNEDIGDEKELLLDNDLYTINSHSFFKCTDLIGKLIIPESVETIGYGTFSLCSGFTLLKLNNGLKKIYDYAFYKCIGFTGELVIPDSVEHIGDNAFQNCIGFTGELVIPDSVEHIGFGAFERCNFSKIYVTKKHVYNYYKKWNYECNAEIIEY